jgi:hypothetical protein
MTCTYWATDGQNYDFTFQGKGNYSSINVNTSAQEYQLASTVIDLPTSPWGQWNLTVNTNLNNKALRALGTAQTGTDYATQANNNNVATQLASSSSKLLGLQTINPYSSRDMNTYRPQLYTSYVRQNDFFGYLAEKDSPINNDNSNSGAASRTGKINLISLTTYKNNLSQKR